MTREEQARELFERIIDGDDPFDAKDLERVLAACALEARRSGIVQGREQVLLMLSDDLAKEIRDELAEHDGRQDLGATKGSGR